MYSMNYSARTYYLIRRRVLLDKVNDKSEEVRFGAIPAGVGHREVSEKVTRAIRHNSIN